VRCTSCGQENPAGAAYCLRCGAQLGEAAARAEATASERAAEQSDAQQMAPTPPVSHEAGETELTHRGLAFGAGYGADFYGVWDLRVAGEPVARFERTPIGWEAAWRKFQELDRQYAVRPWQRSSVGWIILHILIGFIGSGFVLGVVLGAVLLAAGRDLGQPESARTIAINTLAVLIGLVAWLMFVYLKRSRRVRWTVFLATLLGGFAVAVVVSLIDQPAA
jgi:heme/copper-type cytochrome/quinol oxidase subunit 4